MPEFIYNKKLHNVIAVLFIILTSFIRGLGFGLEGESFDLFSGLMGILLMTVVLTVCYVMLKITSRGYHSLGSVLRLEILYVCFVPRVSILYLQRFLHPVEMFAIREGLTKENLSGALGMWLPEVLPMLQLLVPVLFLLVGARRMLEDQESTDFPKWYRYAGAVCFLLAFLVLIFGALSNLFMYIIYLLLVCIIFDLWEKIRRANSLEPTGMVNTAEDILFVALWLQALVQVIG